MSFQNLTKREQHIKSIFLPDIKSPKKEYLPEDDVNDIVFAISNIGERYGFIGDKQNQDEEKSSKRKHKYDVWIAKEIKKDIDLLNHFNKIRFILDWAIETKADIFTYTFEQAFSEQDIWHKKLFEENNIEDIKIPKLDNERVIFRCSNKTHFLYLLKPEDLTYEGNKMNMCVGGDNYKQKVRNGRSIILSLRDEKNIPHVTTEIDTMSGNIVQQSGNSNLTPKPEYQNMIIEFVLFATNYGKIKNYELLKLLNLNQTL